MQKVIKQRLEWGIAIATDAAFVLTGVTLLVVAKVTGLDEWPWVYVGFFLAAIGAVGEVILGVARANYATNHPD